MSYSPKKKTVLRKFEKFCISKNNLLRKMLKSVCDISMSTSCFIHVYRYRYLDYTV